MGKKTSAELKEEMKQCRAIVEKKKQEVAEKKKRLEELKQQITELKKNE